MKDVVLDYPNRSANVFNRRGVWRY